MSLAFASAIIFSCSAFPLAASSSAKYFSLTASI
jgi:hypothetical protein